MQALDARPGPAATTFHLAALHRQIDVVAARIAGDDLESGAEHRIGDLGELIRIRARSGRADDQLAPQRVREGRDAARVPGDADADLVVGAADPAEPGRVE